MCRRSFSNGSVRFLLVPWTIAPYWSMDLFYGLSLLLCRNRLELLQARRLLTAQLIAIPIFIFFPPPTRLTAPATDGFPGLLFGALDQAVGRPYNLAPSLHIALLTILWPFYARHVPASRSRLCIFGSALIGVSVLTTFQHHIFDVPTGALLGFFCLWSGRKRADRHSRTPRSRAIRSCWLAAIYFAGACVCAALAITLWGPWLLLLWPAVSLLVVAAAYAFLARRRFRRTPKGE